MPSLGRAIAVGVSGGIEAFGSSCMEEAEDEMADGGPVLSNEGYVCWDIVCACVCEAERTVIDGTEEVEEGSDAIACGRVQMGSLFRCVFFLFFLNGAK